MRAAAKGSDFAGNVTESKTIQVVKDTQIKNNTWRITNSSTPLGRVDRDDFFKNISTTLYFADIEDEWLTYNGTTYKSGLKDFTYKLFYGTKESDGTVNWQQTLLQKVTRIFGQKRLISLITKRHVYLYVSGSRYKRNSYFSLSR